VSTKRPNKLVLASLKDYHAILSDKLQFISGFYFQHRVSHISFIHQKYTNVGNSSMIQTDRWTAMLSYQCNILVD